MAFRCMPLVMECIRGAAAFSTAFLACTWAAGDCRDIRRAITSYVLCLLLRLVAAGMLSLVTSLHDLGQAA